MKRDRLFSAIRPALFFWFLSGIIFCSTANADDAIPEDYTIMQKKICGQYCLTVILRYLGKNVELSDLYSAVPPERGTSLLQLRRLAEAYELETLGVNVTEDTLIAVGSPAILHVNGDHFIALLPEENGVHYVVIDPPQSSRINRTEDLTGRWEWDGNCLFVDTKEIVLPKEASLTKFKKRYYMYGAVLFFTVILIGRGFLRSSNVLSNFSTQPKVLLCCCILVIPVTFGCREKEEQRVATDLKPQISIAEPVFDAGIVFEETNTVTHPFIIENKGSTDLLITGVKTDCSCTTVGDTIQTIPPGESLPLEITFHLMGKYGKLAPRRTAIITNDPIHPNTVVTMHVERRREFTIDPPNAFMGIIPNGKEKVIFIKIKPGAEDKRLDVSKSTISSSHLKVFPIQNIAAPDKGNEYLLKVQLLPGTPVGILTEQITIPCTGSIRETLEIPVYAEIVGPISTSLSEVQFGLLSNTQIKLIQLWSQDPFEIIEISSDQAWLEVTKKKVDDKKSSLTVSVNPANAVKGELKGNIMIETSNPNQNRIEIPVFAFSM